MHATPTSRGVSTTSGRSASGTLTSPPLPCWACSSATCRARSSRSRCAWPRALHLALDRAHQGRQAPGLRDPLALLAPADQPADRDARHAALAHPPHGRLSRRPPTMDFERLSGDLKELRRRNRTLGAAVGLLAAGHVLALTVVLNLLGDGAHGGRAAVDQQVVLGHARQGQRRVPGTDGQLRRLAGARRHAGFDRLEEGHPARLRRARAARRAEDPPGARGRATQAHQRKHRFRAAAARAQRGRPVVVVRGRLRTLVNGVETANDLKAYLVEFSYAGAACISRPSRRFPMRPRSLTGTPSTLRLAALIALAGLPPASHALQVVEAATAWRSRRSSRSRSRPASASRVRRSPTCSATSTPAHCGGLSARARLAAARRWRPSHPAVNPAGEVVVECDRDKGEIYVRPVGRRQRWQRRRGKPVNLFVSSAHATYTLLLRRADTPADTIVIRDKDAAGRAAVAAPRPRPPAGSASPTTSAP
jgi:hypothetical protein